MLTSKQHELLMFIHERIQKTGVSPSFDEMKDALTLKSKSGIHRLITALEERGFIQRLPHRARALAVIKLPENVAPSPKGFTPNVIDGARRQPHGMLRYREKPVVEQTHALEVPLIGRISAGTPIEALQNTQNHLSVPGYMIEGGGEHYALEVQGDSMIDVGIHDGDTVIIRRTTTAQSGEIVVALVIEDNEATLKRLRRRGTAIALEAANPAYETRIYGPDQVDIQGVLIGLLRRY